VFGPETFVEHVGGRLRVRRSRRAGGRIAAVRADGPGSTTLVRLLAVESGRRVGRAADAGRPDIVVPRANETMVRAVVCSSGAGGLMRETRHYRFGARKRPNAPSAACRPMGQSGSDGAQNRPSGQSRQGSC